MTTRRLHIAVLVTSFAAACGGGGASSGGGGSTAGGGTSSGGGSGDEFQLTSSTTAGQAHGDHPSQITATATEAAMRLFVVDPDTGPTTGVVVKLTGADGQSYYTGETDSQGYAEVLVPVGQRYDLEYLSLGRRSTRAHVEVPSGPNQDIRLTLRYRRWRPPPPTPAAPQPGGLRLDGILFETGSATIDPESNSRLDRLVEYMQHVTTVRVRIIGHTDNVGDPARNQTLSTTRAEAVRDYLVSHGIAANRVEAVGFGDTRPVATNDTEEGRAQNRRIEAMEL